MASRARQGALARCLEPDLMIPRHLEESLPLKGSDRFLGAPRSLLRYPREGYGGSIFGSGIVRMGAGLTYYRS